MTRPIRLMLVLSLVSGLAGCGGDFRPFAFLDREDRRTDVPPPPSVEEEEATSEEEASEGVTPPATGTLGTTVATLGDPARAGLWLETPLVMVETPGRIETESGATLDVTLIPSGGLPGSGSRISLAAMQALGLGLTDLATLTVIADG